MNCTLCPDHACLTLGDCTSRRFDKETSLQVYQEESTQEVVEYSLDRGYKHLGIAYCRGMEKDVAIIAELVHKVVCNPLEQAEQFNAEKVD